MYGFVLDFFPKGFILIRVRLDLYTRLLFSKLPSETLVCIPIYISYRLPKCEHWVRKKEKKKKLAAWTLIRSCNRLPKKKVAMISSSAP